MSRVTQDMIVAASVMALVGIARATNAVAQPGPLGISGEINGAPFRVVVPADWSGTLLEVAASSRA